MKLKTGKNCRARTSLLDFFQIAQSLVFEEKKRREAEKKTKAAMV